MASFTKQKTLLFNGLINLLFVYIYVLKDLLWNICLALGCKDMPYIFFYWLCSFAFQFFTYDPALVHLCMLYNNYIGIQLYFSSFSEAIFPALSSKSVLLPFIFVCFYFVLIYFCASINVFQYYRFIVCLNTEDPPYLWFCFLHF